MSFETYAAAIVFLCIPVLIVAAFFRGVRSLQGTAIKRKERPLSFWLHLAGWSGFLLICGTLLWAQDARGARLLGLLPLLAIMLPTGLAIRQAALTGRISGTTRVAQPSAYWTALFGMALFLFLIAALSIMTLVQLASF